jgi:hypothetical protein
MHDHLNNDLSSAGSLSIGDPRFEHFVNNRSPWLRFNETTGAVVPADAIRFLGLAFATANLLFEVDHQSAVTFAAGREPTAKRARRRRTFRRVLADPARRTRPFTGRGPDGRRGGGPATRTGPGAAGGGGRPQGLLRQPVGLPPALQRRTGLLRPHPDRTTAGRGRLNGVLHDSERFEASARTLIETAQARGVEQELGLIELAGLSDKKAALDEDKAEALQRRVTGALRAEAVGDLGAISATTGSLSSAATRTGTRSWSAGSAGCSARALIPRSRRSA